MTQEAQLQVPKHCQQSGALRKPAGMSSLSCTREGLSVLTPELENVKQEQ